jgi:hypothetical protein
VYKLNVWDIRYWYLYLLKCFLWYSMVVLIWIYPTLFFSWEHSLLFLLYGGLIIQANCCSNC